MRPADPRTPRLAALLLALPLAALAPVAAQAETLTVTNIVGAGAAGYTLAIPEVSVVDGNLTEDQVRALFSSYSTDSLASLANLSAASLTIPDIATTYTPATGEGTIILHYKNVELKNVVAGVADSVSVGEISADAPNAANFHLAVGPLTNTHFSIPATLGFYGVGPAAGGNDFIPVYDAAHLGGGTASGDGFNCTINALDGGPFSIKPLKTSMFEVTGLLRQLQDDQTAGKDPAPADIATIVNFYADFFTSMQGSPAKFGGLTCNITAPGDEGTITLAGFDLDGFQPGIYPQFSMDGLKVDAGKNGQFSLGNFTFKKVDLNGPIAAVRGADGNFSADWLAQHALELIPVFDGLSLKGFSGDFSSPSGAVPMHVAVDDFDLSLGHYVAGTPTDIDATVAGLEFPIPPDSTDESALALRKAGITSLHMDLADKFHWDDANSSLVIDQMMVDTAQLGRIAISGTIGNVTDDAVRAGLFASLFTGQPSPALTALTIKDATIDITDRGGGKLLVAAGAADAKQTEPAFRIYLAGLMQGMTMAVLGNTDDALKAAKAVGDFLGGAPELKLTIKSVDPDGISFEELMGASGDPTKLVGKFTIVAETSRTAPTPDQSTGNTVPQEKLDLKAPAKPR